MSIYIAFTIPFLMIFSSLFLYLSFIHLFSNLHYILDDTIHSHPDSVDQNEQLQHGFSARNLNATIQPPPHLGTASALPNPFSLASFVRLAATPMVARKYRLHSLAKRRLDVNS
jgi:hypothetical protein